VRHGLRVKLTVTRAFSTLSLLLLLSSLAGAAGGVRSDGYWWDDLPNNARGDVTTGAMSAYRTGWSDGVLAAEAASLDGISRAALSDGQKAALGQSLRRALVSALQTRSPSFNANPLATYVEKINGFFAQHPDVASMTFARVFTCIQDKPSRTCDTIATAYEKEKAAAALR